MTNSIRATLGLATLLLVLMCSVSHTVIAQPQLDPLTAGKSYIVAFPDTTKNTFDARYPNTRYEDKVFILMFAAVETPFTVRGKSYEFADTIEAGTTYLLDLMSSTLRAPQ